MSTDFTPIPMVDLQAAHAEVAEDVERGFRGVLESGGFIKGPEVEAFEREFAAFSEVSHCVGVSSGTDAIELALRAVDVPAGSEVILPANTFVATAEAVVRAGARPVLVDVDPEYLLIDPVLARKAVTADTSAVIPVHLYGQLAPMAPLGELAREHDIAIVEDAAQSHGAGQDGLQSGAIGAAAGVSFYPGKNLGAYGDGGAVLTNSETVAHKVRLLGDHGSERKYVHERLGFNSRLDALQAVVLRVKLRRLHEWNERRRAAAARYEEMLTGLDELVLPRTAPGNVHVWHLYTVQVPRRDAVLAALQARGVHAGIHYPVPVHLQPAFRSYGYAPGDFPVAEEGASRTLSLPLYPHITAEQQSVVAQALRDALQA